MNIPDAAIEAAAEAIYKTMGSRDDDFTLEARAAIEASLPVIREALAQEILAMDDRPEGRMMHSCAIEAARIVRGGTP